MNINHQQFKRIVNGVFLTLSCFLIVYFLVQITDNVIIRIGIGIFAVVLDIFMQYVLGLGRNHYRRKKFGLAAVLFFCYGSYVLIYAMPSAIGFFMVEIDATEQIFKQSAIHDSRRQIRLDQVNQLIDALTTQLETEAKTGYGTRSQEIIDRINDLSSEQKELQKTFENVSVTPVNVSKNIFKSLSNVFPVSENILKVLIFGVSVLMLYLGLILTAWDIGDEVPDAPDIPLIKVAEEPYGEKRELVEFTAALFEDGYRRLNGNQRVFEKTGIPLDKCAEYRDFLSGLQINGVPAINRIQGASVANFPKEFLVEYIKKY